MYTKQDCVNMVNAMPESKFERCDGIEINQAPNRLEKGLAYAYIGGAILMVVGLGAAMFADGIMALAHKADEWNDNRKAKKAAAEAAIHEALDKSKPQS